MHPHRLVVLLFSLACGCSPLLEESAAFDLVLAPDPSLASPAQLAAQLQSIEVVLDSPQGLYPPQDARAEERFEIVNRDADESLEIVFHAEVAAQQLPDMRIERGGLPDVDLDIQVIGQAKEGATLHAIGGLSGVRFPSDSVAELVVPFNVIPERLPPRVVEVFPSPDIEVNCDLAMVVIIFSKPIAQDTLIANESVRIGEGVTLGPANLELGRISTFGVLGSGLPEHTTFDLEVGPGVTDEQGRPLDQLPARTGDAVYSSSFSTVNCFGREINWCGEGTGMALCPPSLGERLACIDGVCRPTHCDDVLCPEGFVCDVATSTCEVDCRLYGSVGVCPSDRPSCDLESGSCQALQ